MINNRDDANKYYQILNDLVDNYIDTWKIRPSNLSRYLKPNSDRFNKFLEKNKLKDIKGIDRVLKDVIEDRENMEKDGIIKFESFKMFESDEFKIKSLTQCLYKGINKASNEMEKELADFFDSSLGQIDIIDADKHIFKINNWEESEINVIIYGDDEIEIIKHNIIDYLFNELVKKKIEIVQNITVDLSDLIKNSLFEEQMEKKFNSEFLIEVITNCLQNYNFKGKSGNYKIWVEK